MSTNALTHQMVAREMVKAFAESHKKFERAHTPHPNPLPQGARAQEAA